MASEIKVNNIKRATGTTITLGESGDTISLACGASSTGFGAITWCSSVKTALFTAEAGKGYFINTCGGGYTVTLPATASVGDQINFTDYSRTWGTACKELTLNQNSLNFQGNTCPNPIYDTDGATVKIVYSGATQGWLPQLDKGTELETPQSYNVQYLVVAGGGGGGAMKTGTSPGSPTGEGGGGAGGYRTVATKSFAVLPCTSFPITIGGGGSAGEGNPTTQATAGANSIFSTITSAGGGLGGSGSNPNTGGTELDGGSGGGAGRPGAPSTAAGSGNVPSVSPPQGNPGGVSDGLSNGKGGGGGGAGGAGTAGPAGTGGVGSPSCISGADVTRAVGGGGGAAGGDPGAAGGANTGTGGGAGNKTGPDNASGGAGGSGVVIIRRLTACSTSTSGTVTTCGSDTIHTFTGDGTFVS